MKKDEEKVLSSNCAFRLGKSFAALVSDQLKREMVISCTEGPLAGSEWKVPYGVTVLSCGRAKKNQICLPDVSDIEDSEFQVYRYNGWFAISDTAIRAELDEVERAKEDEKEKDKEKGDTASDKSINPVSKGRKSGIFLNGKRIKRREMNFLWQGCEIKIGYEEKQNESKETKWKYLSTFIVKCNFKGLNK